MRHPSVMCHLLADRMRGLNTPTTTPAGGAPGSGSRWSEVREGDDSRVTAAELGGPGGAYRQWIIQQNFFSEGRFHGALPITLHDMLFEMPAGLDQLFIPPNDDILLPDDDLPPPPVQKPKAKRKRKEIKFLTEDELARLFSVIPSVRDRAMFQIAYRAGLRASEVGLLQLRDYDPKADRIFIHRLKGSNSGHHHLMREEAHRKTRSTALWPKWAGAVEGSAARHAQDQ